MNAENNAAWPSDAACDPPGRVRRPISSKVACHHRDLAKLGRRQRQASWTLSVNSARQTPAEVMFADA